MLSVFSFKGHFLESLLNNAALMFPGADKLLAVYYDNSLPGLKSREKQLENPGESKVIRDVDIASDQSVKNLRKQRPRSTWLKNLDIKAVISPTRTQLDIQSELDNHVLLIRFPNAPDGFSDLLFIFFKNEDRIFQFRGNPQKLGTSLKETVANMLVRALDVFRKQTENDLSVFKLIKQSDNLLNTEIIMLREQLENKNKIQLNHFRELVSSISDPISTRTGIIFKWTDECLLKIIGLNLPFKAIKPLIENTITVLFNRELSPHPIIEINALDLLINDFEYKKESQPVISNRYQRTLMLLDRYEESAKKVVRAKLPLTGVNLGKYCNPSVSPAAISDALKKHSKKIITLFDKNPNRWSLLRQEFRPVKNMVFKSGMPQYLAS